MNGNVLREFLISLGFQIDNAGLKKFTTAVEGVTAGVAAAGLAVSGTAAGIVAGVKIISSQMEKLYYASQRTGATVENIMALRYAAGQIGLTADQAQGSLENFARTLRLNPGSSSLLDSLGVTGKDPAEKFDSFISKMKSEQPYVAAAYAQLFGIDPDTLLMLEQGQDKRLESEQKYHQKLGRYGINADQAASSGKDFNNAIRDVTSDFQLLWIVIESKLVPVLTPLIAKFEKWSETHAADVANAIATSVRVLGDVIGSIDWDKVTSAIDTFWDTAKTAFSVGIAWMIDFWKTLVSMFQNNTYYLRTILEFLFLAPEALIHHWSTVKDFFGWMWGGIKEAFSSAWTYISPIVDKLKVAVQWISNSWLGRKIAGVLEATPALLDQEYGYTPGGKPELSPGEEYVPDGDTSKHPELGDGEQYVGGPSSRAPRGIRNNNPGNLRFGGFTKQAGATGQDDKGFAVFSSMEQGMQAALALLRSYVSRGYDTVRSIISRWAPAGENNTDAYVDAVAKKLGISADAHLNGDQLAGVAGAIFQHENGRAFDNVNSMGGARLGAGSSSSPNVSIQQTNTFHIPGSSDPQGTARAVGGEQSRVNGDLVRNFAGAFR